MYDRVVDVPRLLCYYGVRPAARPGAGRARTRSAGTTGRALGEPLRTVGLCLYRDGRDSVAWHGDRSGRQVHDTVVAILSLGAPGADAAAARRRAGPCGTRSATATCW